LVSPRRQWCMTARAPAPTARGMLSGRHDHDVAHFSVLGQNTYRTPDTDHREVIQTHCAESLP
jgi:hypothetical protein